MLVLMLLLSMAAFGSSEEKSLFDGPGAHRRNSIEVSQLPKVDGKVSPILAHWKRDNPILEIELTQLAYVPPPGTDKSKYTGLTKGKIRRVYKGQAKIGDEIEFKGGIVNWSVGDAVVIFLDDQLKPRLIVPSSNSFLQDFTSAMRPFAGKAIIDDSEISEVIRGARKKIENECSAISNVSEKKKCLGRLSFW